MIKLFKSAALCLFVCAPFAAAYEYPLQYTPNAGHRGLVVAGYYFNGNDIVGNCSYYIVSGHGSGRGGGAAGAKKQFNQTCTWDQFGNLLSVSPGAPTAPAPLYTKGSLVVYAQNAAGDITGIDMKLPGRGFVNTPGAHYTWLNPQTDAVIQQSVHTFTFALKSDGDMPVDITAVVPSALHGIVTLKGTNCIGDIKVGSPCAIQVTYDPTKLTSTTAVAYDTLRIDLTSTANEAHDFIQKFSIVIPQKLIE